MSAEEFLTQLKRKANACFPEDKPSTLELWNRAQTGLREPLMLKLECYPDWPETFELWCDWVVRVDGIGTVARMAREYHAKLREGGTE